MESRTKRERYDQSIQYQLATRGKFGGKPYDMAQQRSYSAASQQATAQQSGQAEQFACMYVVSMLARLIS